MNRINAIQQLQKLRQEYQGGKTMKQDLTHRLTNLETTLLRISGAIQVLEELAHGADAPATAATDPVSPKTHQQA